MPIGEANGKMLAGGEHNRRAMGAALTSLINGESVKDPGPLRMWLPLGAAVLVLASCKPDVKANLAEVRPVRTVIAAKGEAGETVSLTGHIQAEDEAALGFTLQGGS
jgi:hypothetical protein